MIQFFIFILLAASALPLALPATLVYSSGARNAVIPFGFVAHRQGLRMKSAALKTQGRGSCSKPLKAKVFAAALRSAALDKAQDLTWILHAKLSGDKKAQDYRLNRAGLDATLFANPRALSQKKILSLEGKHHTLYFRVGKCRWYLPAIPWQQSGSIDLMEVTRDEFITLVEALQKSARPIWPSRAPVFKRSASPGRGKSLGRMRGAINRSQKESLAKPSSFKAEPLNEFLKSPASLPSSK